MAHDIHIFVQTLSDSKTVETDDHRDNAASSKREVEEEEIILPLRQELVCRGRELSSYSLLLKYCHLRNGSALRLYWRVIPLLIRMPAGKLFLRVGWEDMGSSVMRTVQQKVRVPRQNRLTFALPKHVTTRSIQTEVSPFPACPVIIICVTMLRGKILTVEVKTRESIIDVKRKILGTMTALEIDGCCNTAVNAKCKVVEKGSILPLHQSLMYGKLDLSSYDDLMVLYVRESMPRLYWEAIQLLIKTLTGKMISLEGGSEYMISGVMRRSRYKERVSPDLQQLILARCRQQTYGKMLNLQTSISLDPTCPKIGRAHV